MNSYSRNGEPSRSPFSNRNGSPEMEMPSEVLRRLLERNKEDHVEVLEKAVKRVNKDLETVQRPFTTHPDLRRYCDKWDHVLDTLRGRATPKRTVIGVMGRTGVGKSSIINALLDEEAMVPTNCTKACTAFPIEISWNYDEDTSSAYRAEIEFISREEWQKELEVLLAEMLTEDCIASSGESGEPKVETSISWAKFHAVYPPISRRDALRHDPFKLANDADLELLGSKQTFAHAEPSTFYRSVQAWAASRGRSIGKKDATPTESESWPLIKVVKIYTRSPALSTGAVIVDLPGTHDSNAARVAVNDRYIEECTWVWIVAAITRAVDDKSAKELLGAAFKRQLKFDGALSNISFICSKTDDITVSEAIESLNLDDTMERLDSKAAECDRRIQALKRDLDDLKKRKDFHEDMMEKTEEQMKAWELRQTELDAGGIIHASEEHLVAKRKRTAADNGQRKRARTSPADSDSPTDELEDGVEISKVSYPEVNDAPALLTTEDVHTKLDELRHAKKSARSQILSLKTETKSTRQHMSRLEQKREQISAQRYMACIAGRNDFSQRAIQADFAVGIKELDQEAASEDDDGSVSMNDVRDYEDAASSLPVFCVSSRAYQKLRGRLEKTRPVYGFTTLEDTQIPQLRAHCEKLTEARRCQHCLGFLHEYSRLHTSISLWASHIDGDQLTEVERRREIHFLNQKIRTMSIEFTEIIQSCVKDLQRHVKEHIFDHDPAHCQRAATAAPATVENWATPKADGGKGLPWQTYRAAVRRSGYFESSKAGRCDFNADLMEPLVKSTAPGWDRAFNRRLPGSIKSHCAKLILTVDAFHSAFEQRSQQNEICLAKMRTLGAQLSNYGYSFRDLEYDTLATMKSNQRAINRQYSSHMCQVMQPIYTPCSQDSGKLL